MLTIQITSFSYGKGYPQDLSGHGGGFIFDCRCIKNPGLIDRLRPLTGKDIPVTDYLESETEMPRFLNRIHEILKTAIDDYQNKGYTSLSICFGCTGGQHRSVYAAEQTAIWINREYGELIFTTKIHREFPDLV